MLRVTDLITSLIYSLLSPSLFTTTDLDMTHSFLLRSYPLSPLRSFKPPVSDPSPTPPLSRRYFPPLTTNLLPPKNPFISTVSTFSLVCSMPSHGYGVVQHLIKFLYTSAYGYGVCLIYTCTSVFVHPNILCINLKQWRFYSMMKVY